VSLLVSWIGLPLVLGLVSLGCALALERASGVNIARALLLPVGLTVVIVLAQALTAVGVTAKLATPAVAVVAVAGLVIARRRARRVFGPWLIAALVVYLVYGLPVLASGANTFTGYMKLDDTASWLALVDYVMSHGRDVHGLAPSSYEAVVSLYLAGGYPLGGFLGLGVIGQLLGTDAMWLYQPFLAYAGAMLALALYELSRRFLSRSAASFAVAAIAAQPATLYAYSLWGGIKEMVAAAMLPLVAALAGASRGAPARGRGLGGARAMLPLAIACSALLATLSFGAIVWIAPLTLPALLAGAGVTRRAPWRAVRLPSLGWLAALGALCSLPVIALAPTFLAPLFASGPGGGGVFADEGELGNLVHGLDLRQLAGIWPVGDFRVAPDHIALVDVPIALAVVLGMLGVVVAWRRGQRALPAYVLGTVAVSLAIRAHSSPWVDGKSLAQSSPAILFAALCATALAWRRRELRWLGWAAAGTIAAGVLWSNVLAYRAVNLAPRDQLLELQHVAALAAGRGPALYPDASIVGARHILRAADAENASELRRRRVPLRDGSTLPPDAQADVDDFDQKQLLVYRSLILRRAPDASRPASAYRLRWAGRYYEFWERAPGARRPVEHLTLGSGAGAGAVPRCADVLRLARAAGAGGTLATVVRGEPTVVGLGGGALPRRWLALRRLAGGVIPAGTGTIERAFSVTAGGRMRAWLRGSTRARTTLLVDGRRIASVRHELSWVGRYTPFGEVELQPGRHRLTLRYDDSGPEPGNRGQTVNPFYFGPVVLSRETADRPLLSVAAARGRTLCGRRLDWIEAFRAPHDA
jgi:hypothetical protein